MVGLAPGLGPGIHVVVSGKLDLTRASQPPRCGMLIIETEIRKSSRQGARGAAELGGVAAVRDAFTRFQMQPYAR